MTSGDNSITCESGLDSDVVLSYGTFYNVKSGDTIKLLDRIVVTEEVKEFTVWMWIDSNGTDLSSLSGETIDANLWTEFTMYDESGPKVIVNFDLNGGNSVGGGGFYGGNSSGGGGSGSASGGGSGYIGNSLLYDKYMYCYNCEISDNEHTLTYTTSNVSFQPVSNYAKTGDGAAKITFLYSKKELTYGSVYGELPIPIKEELVFSGWYTEDGVEVLESTVLENREDHTLYARWEELYDINYDVNGGMFIDNIYTSVGEHQLIIPIDAEYQLEVWGAQGGSGKTSGKRGGYGGYSTGKIFLTANEQTYINVGGQGATPTSISVATWVGGYNGGGSGSCSGSGGKYGAGGGGASHIATKSGILSEFKNYTDDLLIVAGGGGAGFNHSSSSLDAIGGDGGGYIGVGNTPGTQLSGGGTFGQGYNSTSGGSGGGGGYYGGEYDEVKAQEYLDGVNAIIDENNRIREEERLRIYDDVLATTIDNQDRRFDRCNNRVLSNEQEIEGLDNQIAALQANIDKAKGVNVNFNPFISSSDTIISFRDYGNVDEMERQLVKLQQQRTDLINESIELKNERDEAFGRGLVLHTMSRDFALSSSSENFTIDPRYSEYYEYLTPEEQQIIIYLQNTGRDGKIEKYYDLKQIQFNQIKAQEEAQNVIDNVNYLSTRENNTGGRIDNGWEFLDIIVKSMQNSIAGTPGESLPTNDERVFQYLVGVGFSDGVKNFDQGMRNLWSADGVPSVDQFKTAYIVEVLKEVYGSDGLFGGNAFTSIYEISSSIGNMAPAMAISALTTALTKNIAVGAKIGEMFGTTVMGLSAAGNAREQGLQQGMTDRQSWNYGLMSGSSEAAIGFVLGGIPFLSRLDDIPGIKGYFCKMLSEGLEESIQSILDPMFVAVATNNEHKFDFNSIDWNEVGKSGFYGLITAGILNGANIFQTATPDNIVKNEIGNVGYYLDAKISDEILAKYEGKNFTDPAVLDEFRNDLETAVGLDGNSVIFRIGNVEYAISRNLASQLLDKYGNNDTTKRSVMNQFVADIENTSGVISTELSDGKSKKGVYYVDESGEKIISSLDGKFGEVTDIFNDLELLGEMQARLNDMGIDTSDMSFDDMKTKYPDVYDEVVNLITSKISNSLQNDGMIDVENALFASIEDSNVKKKIKNIAGKVKKLIISFDNFSSNFGENISNDVRQFFSDIKAVLVSNLDYINGVIEQDIDDVIVDDVEYADDFYTNSFELSNRMQSFLNSISEIFNKYRNRLVEFPMTLTLDKTYNYSNLIFKINDIFESVKGYLSSFKDLFDVHDNVLNDRDPVDIFLEIRPTDSPEILELYSSIGQHIKEFNEKGLYTIFNSKEFRNMLLEIEKLENLSLLCDIYFDYDGKTQISRELGEFLEGLIENDNLIIGMHNTPIYDDNILNSSRVKSVLKNGLSNSGNNYGEVPSLTFTVAFLDKMSNLIGRINSRYKDSRGGFLFAFPKDLVDANGNIINQAAIEQIYIKNGDGYYINPKYILGYVGYGDDKVVKFYSRSEVLDAFASTVVEEKSNLSEVENRYSNGANIKKEIYDRMPTNLDIIQKIRYLYLELNKRVTYEYGYFSLYDGTDIKNNYFKENLSFDTMKNNRVVCFGWSKLYKELLIDAGIPSEMVSVKGNNGHQWVEIEFDDYIIRADATDGFNHSTDLSASKSGSATNGFLKIGKDLSGVNINKVEIKEDEKGNASVFRIYNSLSKDDTWLRKIDNVIGYANNGVYFNEAVSKLMKEFYSPDAVNEIFGGNENDVFLSKWDYFIKLNVPKNMNAYDAYVYFQQTKYAIFEKDTRISIDMYNNSFNNNDVPVGALCVLRKNSDGSYIGKIIDDVRGVWIVKFKDYSEYKKYIENLGYSEKKVRGC